MPLIKTNWEPSDRQLKQFAGLCAVVLPLIAWWWHASAAVLAGVAVAGGLIAAVGLIAPKWVKPLFLGLTMITMPIGIVVGELALLTIYALVFVPISVLFRVVGRDRLQVKRPRNSRTFWQAKTKPKSLASYYRQS